MSWICDKCGNMNKYDIRPCTKCSVDMPVIKKPAVKEVVTEIINPKKSHKKKT